MPDDAAVTSTELHYLTIADAARLIKQRRLSPVELTQAYLDRIEAVASRPYRESHRPRRIRFEGKGEKIRDGI